jgi:hypothetical protein
MRPWRLAPRAALPMPCRRYWRSRGRTRAGFPWRCDTLGMKKQAGDVADLKTCDQHGEFKKRAQQSVFDISGSDENRGEDERARRDENQNLEKPPKNRPQHEAPD